MTSMMRDPDRRAVEAFRRQIERRLGFLTDDSRVDGLAELLRERMRVTGAAAYTEYASHVESSPDELRALAARVTVGETFFFRNDEQFRALAETALPDRIRSRGADQRLRILSAGCSSGEEPFSIAMVLRDVLPHLETWDVTLVAVDVNASALARAREARYSSWALRSTPESERARWFSSVGRDFQLDPAIQRMVKFEEANLVADDERVFGAANWDVIFCRNVIMYFAPPVMARVVARVANALVPGGYLFLGHAETLRGLSSAFHLCHTHGTFYYQRRAGNHEPLRTDPVQRTAAPVPDLPSVVDQASSWMEVIGRASDRIARLTDGRTEQHQGPQAFAAPPLQRELAVELIRQERFAEALELLQGVAVADTDGLLLRAVALTNSGALEEAEVACRALLTADELSAGGHYLMALCREHAGDRDAAVEHDRTAMYLDPGFAMPHIHFALLAKRAAETSAARGAMQQALALLAREDAARLLLFGGGFSRDALMELCRSELRSLGGEP